MSTKKSPVKKHPYKLSGFFGLVRKIIFGFFISTIFIVFVYRFINPPVTWLMIERGFERQADGKEWKIDKQWRNYEEISDHLKRAAMAGEDVNFMNHWGFDFKSIEKAYQKNQKSEKIRGGSTISQQTAKNVFLWPGRSWIRKGFEAYFTVLIELLWGKKRILEVYLNIIETGDGLYGAEAASKYYFHKTSASLSRNEAALLVAVFPNPVKWTPARPTTYIRYKQQLILKNMWRLRNIKL